MSDIYFPGANTGCGFFSRFSGIIPHGEQNYTYVLKGGPGVGKNTLMRTVADRARKKGMTVEEFRCASDPKSFDAVRILDIKTVLLDGTAPHSIDPVVPGIEDEIIDLGHFKNKKEFSKQKNELDKLFCENKKCYRKAYSLLGAARLLKEEAFSAAKDALDTEKLRGFLAPIIKNATSGAARELFAASATPCGVVDFTDSFADKNTVFLSGILGEAAISEACKMLDGKRVTIGYGFTVPTLPIAIRTEGFSVAVGEGETLIGLCSSPLPTHLPKFLAESELLTDMATDALSGALKTHDKIEEIYRPYVDYDRVNEESEKLLKELNL